MMRKIVKPFVFILFVFIFLTISNVYSQNFLTNGDFEFGGSGNGFFVNNTGYSLATSFGTSAPGNYAFVTNPNSLNTSFISGGDHTTGTGKMMVVDGSTLSGLNFFWSTKSSTGIGASDIPGFVIGQRYIFSYWIKSISSNVINPATQADITFFSPDAISIVPLTLNSLAPLPAQGWQQVSYTFTATDVNVLIRLSNSNINPLGNDFAIDDMSIVCATPPTLIISNPASVCVPSTVDLTLAAVTAGSDPGTLSYFTDAAGNTTLSNPTAVATAGTYYIKNEVSGCVTIKPVEVTIQTNSLTPPTVSAIAICQSKTPVALTATLTVGSTLIWYGTNATLGTPSLTAPIPSTAVVGVTNYYVSQIRGVCESARASIPVNVAVDTGVTFSPLLCDSDKILPADKNSSVYFDWNQPSSISNVFNYSYAIQGGLPVTGKILGTGTHLQVFGMSPGQSATLTITSASHPCTTATWTCKVPCPLPLLKPDFPPITKIYCVGNTIPNLPNISPTTGISGTWSPSNVISNAASGTYIFTPDPILFPCAESQTLTVTVNPLASPTFSGLPVSVCQNSISQVLPTSSTNIIQITGTWGPSPSINTTILGPTIYTFIPDSGQCVSSTPTTINVTVNSSAAPTFNPIPAFCAGTSLPSFPVSTNTPQISGTWNPPSIDNTITKEYEFTPDIGLHPCAPKTKITVTVNPNVTPTFSTSDIQCEGTGILTLPLNSSNVPQISGSWSPATVDTSILGSNTYEFTPDVGSCVISPTFQKTIEVYTSATPTFDPIPDFCSGTPSPSFPLSNEGITGAWFPTSISNGTGTNEYQFTPDTSLFPCAPIPPPLSVTVIQSVTPTFSSGVPTDVCEGATLPDLPLESTDTLPITGIWTPSETIDTSLVGTLSYTFIPEAGQCAIPPTAIDITVNPSSTLTDVSYTVTDAFENNQIITVVATATGNYLYQLDSGPLQTSPIFENVSSGIHTITVSEVNGCSDSITEDNILIIKHPKFFTPNGDNYNDTWKISDLSNLISKIYIFDRYGKLLKEISPDGLGWDGTYLGVQMPADDYWFNIEYIENSVMKKFKSHFSLKR